MAALLALTVFIMMAGCSGPSVKTLTREQAIPADAIKSTPDGDIYRPVALSDGWAAPVPLEGPVNTAGAEDSPFITADGNTFYFFFTPDVRVPPEKQLIDGATGIWWSHRANGTWTKPERVLLNDDVALDGCAFVLGDTMWFGSARAGNYNEVDVYTAKLKGGKWAGWKNAGQQLNDAYDIGEFHLSADGNTLYFGANRTGGSGGKDLWICDRDGDAWGEPANLGPAVNGPGDEDQPFLSSDGRELWFTGWSKSGYTGPSVYRSIKQGDGTWGRPVEIVANFAGEPTLDGDGNIYFVHHYFDNGGKMLEADIYVAYKK